MTRTIDDAFTSYLTRLRPLAGETRAAARHRVSVKACLMASFDVNQFFHTGSFGNGTALRRYSDVDYFAVVPRRLVDNDSRKTLTRFRSALRKTFPQTDIRISAPAVVLPFGRDGCHAIDVVPAVLAARTGQGFDIYDIPNGSGGWMRASPRAHKAYVHTLDAERSYQVKPLIMLLKAWRNLWNVPIHSFYLEMRAARYATSLRTIDFPRDLAGVLETIVGDNRLSTVRDPMDISGVIRPCGTQRQEELAFTKARLALQRARSACHAEEVGRSADAVDRWNLFFNHTLLPHHKRTL